MTLLTFERWGVFAPEWVVRGTVIKGKARGEVLGRVTERAGLLRIELMKLIFVDIFVARNAESPACCFAIEVTRFEFPGLLIF